MYIYIYIYIYIHVTRCTRRCMSQGYAGVTLVVCCSVLQSVAVCCSVLQCVAVWSSMLQYAQTHSSTLQYAAVCCSVSQYIAVCCNTLPCVYQGYAVCCSVLQCVAWCCSVLQELLEANPHWEGAHVCGRGGQARLEHPHLILQAQSPLFGSARLLLHTYIRIQTHEKLN